MSALRCRPGDLAVVVRAPDRLVYLLGRIVTVLYAQPDHPHRLPDGMRHEAAQNLGWWIVEFAHEVEAPMMHSWRSSRCTRYAAVPDWSLRPIRPDADEPATETEREKEAA